MQPLQQLAGQPALRRQFRTASTGSVYHLNMFPLRRDYTRGLMQQVGFQQVTTYGDFQQTYREDEPDFFIHVAEKAYREEE